MSQRIDPATARDALRACDAIDVDYHALSSGQVERLLSFADLYRYRKPRNANGSRARYFHAYLSRAAERQP